MLGGDHDHDQDHHHDQHQTRVPAHDDRAERTRDLPLTDVVPARLAQVTTLLQDHERLVIGRVDTSADEVRSLCESPSLHRELSRCRVLDQDLVGAMIVTLERDQREIGIDAYAAAGLAEAERAHLLRDLVAAAVAGAPAAADAAEPGRAVMPAAPDGDIDPLRWQVTAGTYREDTTWAAALAAGGLHRVRTFSRMRLDHGGAVVEPDPPPGVASIPVVTTDDFRTAHRLAGEVMRDHWGGAAPLPFDQWLAEEQRRPGYDPSQWRIATLDGEPVGVAIAGDVRAEFGAGYVHLLGVIAPARNRGIASFLLREQFAGSARRGLAATELGVDSASLTGADRLYVGVGMRPVQIIDVWLRDV